MPAGRSGVRATGSAGSVLTVWTGAAYEAVPIKRGVAVAGRLSLAAGTEPGASRAAVFTWRGDYCATGWLSEYSRIEA